VDRYLQKCSKFSIVCLLHGSKCFGVDFNTSVNGGVKNVVKPDVNNQIKLKLKGKLSLSIWVMPHTQYITIYTRI